ncbi:hypothetical protein MASR2M78_03650 [Treponema sp.]
MSTLALFGGDPILKEESKDLFLWPIVTEEDEQAVLSVLHDRSMSGTEITKQFEKEMASWLGVEFALGYCNGTSGLLAALWACGVGAGDEVICPSMTYWASAAPALTLGAAVNFADIDPATLCIDLTTSNTGSERGQGYRGEFITLPIPATWTGYSQSR